jgi:hypothetical protein
VKISLVLIKQKFFIDIQWEIRIKIYTNLILLPTIHSIPIKWKSCQLAKVLIHVENH